MSNASGAAKIKGLVEALIPPLVMPYCKRLIRMTPYARGRLVQGPRTVDADQPQVLEAAWKHVKEMASLPEDTLLPATPRWEYFLRRTRDEMCFFSSPREAVHFAQSKINFEHREPIVLCRHLFDLHVATLKNEFRDHGGVLDRLSDSDLSRPETLLRCGDRLVSNIFFWHVRTLLQALTHVKELKCVAEIGGGYGALARHFLNTPEAGLQTYCIIDFPECLFFAEVFLRATFPGLSIYYATDGKALEPAELSKYKVVLCPIRHLSAVSKIPFNLVINTGSMQEMTEEWIEFWMAWLTRQPCRWFYSMNYFGQALDFMAEGGNTWSPRLSKEWAVRVQIYDPPFIRQQSDRNFAEIIAEKTSRPAEPSSSPRAKYEALKDRKMTNVALLDAMDIVRLDYDVEIMWDVLQRIARDVNSMPKEAHFLSTRLRQNPPKNFSPEQLRELETLGQRLDAIRKGGLESGHTI
jgi:putative sugar O-methyltransferase